MARCYPCTNRVLTYPHVCLQHVPPAKYPPREGGTWHSWRISENRLGSVSACFQYPSTQHVYMITVFPPFIKSLFGVTMMTSLTRLPAELFHEIVYLLKNRRDVSALSCVCKYLRDQTLPVLYRGIKWTWDSSPDLHIRFSFLLLRSIVHNPCLGDYVQGLNFGGAESDFDLVYSVASSRDGPLNKQERSELNPLASP